MATAQRASGGPGPQTKELDPAALLEEVLSRSQSQRYQVVNDALSKRIERVEELLPENMKGQGARLVKRAMLTFSKNEKLQQCTPASFISCVLQAAECGLAIDGRLAHAVPYSTKVKGADGRDRWEDIAQFQPDYKGLIAVAKRTGQIVDIYGDVICQNDTFAHGRAGDVCRLEHTYDIQQPRGKTIGAYQIIVLPGGRWRYEVMGIADLDRIQKSSKSGDRGPWGTHPDEMRKKTVAKRALKMYSDDPGLLKALEYDDLDYGDADESPRRTSRVGRSPLNDALKVPVAEKASTFADPTPSPQQQWPAADDDPFAGSQGNDYGDVEPSTTETPRESYSPLDGFLEALGACKNRDQVKLVMNEYMDPVKGATDEHLETIQKEVDLKLAALESGGKAKQKNLMGE
jgi:recombination protein RecT